MDGLKKASHLLRGVLVTIALAYACWWLYSQMRDWAPTTARVALALMFAGWLAHVLGVALRTSRVWRALVLRGAARLPLSWNSGEIRTPGWWYACSLALSIYLGLCCYEDIVHGKFVRLAEAYQRADLVTQVLAQEEPRTNVSTQNQLTDWDVYLLLKHFGLLQPDEVKSGLKSVTAEPNATSITPAQQLARVILKGNNTKQHYYRTNSLKSTAGELPPTLDLIMALSDNLDASPCAWAIRREGISGALAGQPFRLSSNTRWLRSEPMDFNCLDKDSTDPAIPIGRGFQHLSLGEVPWSPPVGYTYQELAAQLGAWNGDPEAGESAVCTNPDPTTDACTFRRMVQARLLLELRSVEDVRSAHMWLNAVIGPERALIIVLALFFSLLLLGRAFQSLPHRATELEIAEFFDDPENAQVFKSASAASRIAAVKKAIAFLRNGRSAAPRGNLLDTSDECNLDTVPMRLLQAAVDEVEGAGRTTPIERNFIDTLSDIERRKLAHSRIFFDAMLPVFPAIGFIGTVLSLLTAMSKADEIVRAADPALRGIATTAVTDSLSLCFATTFMALVCLVLLAPLTLLQADGEQRMLTEIEDRVQKNLTRSMAAGDTETAQPAEEP